MPVATIGSVNRSLPTAVGLSIHAETTRSPALEADERVLLPQLDLPTAAATNICDHMLNHACQYQLLPVHLRHLRRAVARAGDLAGSERRVELGEIVSR